MGGLFGGGDSETKVTQERNIPPATWEEKTLLSDLFNLAHTNYYRPSQQFLDVLSKYYQPSQEFVEAMRNPYLSMLPYKEAWGDYLNQFAQRGVINSTITQNAMAKLGEALAERGAELKFAGLQALEAARQAELADELKRAAMAEDVTRTSIEDQYRQLFNIWQTLYSGRMGVPVSTTTTTTGPGLFSQVAGQALGLGLGYWLGPGGGLSTLGSWAGGLLGGLLGSGATTGATAATSAFLTGGLLP